MIARPYQEHAVCSIFDYFATKFGNPLVALPTGTGKAFVQAEFIRRALYLYPQTRILSLTHVKELVAQNHAELLRIWPQAPAGVYSAGLDRRDTHFPLTFGGIQSLHKRVDWFGHIDLVSVDEAHLISEKSATMYLRTLEALRQRNPFLKVIGLTATPYRTGTGLLTEGGIFTDICCDYTQLDAFNSLVDAGYISPLIPKRTQTELDVSDVAVHGGEFVGSQLQAAVDKQGITRAALEEARALAWNRRHWLVFATGIQHADHIVSMLNEMGISARAVHSELPGGDAERDQNIADYRAGHFQAMVNVGVLTTGFNFAAIDCIVMLRPTMSPGLWVQMLGRGTRPSPETGKLNCLVLDFAANTRRLGPINDPMIPNRRGKKSGFVPYKTCPQCDTYNHTRARFCINCGFLFPETFNATVAADTSELIRRPEKEKKPPKEEAPSVVEEHVVNRVEYAKHYSKDAMKPPSLRATYYCGGRTFNEWLCFEHQGFALKKAHDSWRLMGGSAMPDNIDHALLLVDTLQPPNVIRVLHNGTKWPQVVGYEFGREGIALPLPIAVDDSGDRMTSDDPGRYSPPPLPPFAPGNFMYEVAVENDDIPF